LLLLPRTSVKSLILAASEKVQAKHRKVKKMEYLIYQKGFRTEAIF
jgi:hypothetical protein